MGHQIFLENCTVICISPLSNSQQTVSLKPTPILWNHYHRCMGGCGVQRERAHLLGPRQELSNQPVFWLVLSRLNWVQYKETYVITHSVRTCSMYVVRSMYVVCVCMYVVFCKIDHCIHIHWCIVIGLGHNDPWVESHMWPQQTWGQRSSRGQWPLVQVFGKKSQCTHILWCIFKSNITVIAKVCDHEIRRDTWFENHLVIKFHHSAPP